MTAKQIPAHYRIGWQPDGLRPGQHRGRMHGIGQLFKSHVPLLQQPDPQRLDLRRSMLDTFGGYWVRSYHQRSSIQVVVIADVSASMRYRGQQDKMQRLGDLTASLAESAHRNGDGFGFIACDRTVREELYLPISYRLGSAEYLRQKLIAFTPDVPSAKALKHCQTRLTARRSLIFLISDFHVSPALLEATLHSLSAHDVVPVIIWDSREYQALPDWGLVRLQDLENGRSRTLMLRPQLKQAIVQRYQNRLQQLIRLFLSRGREPLLLRHDDPADQLTRYFYHNG